MPTCNAKVSCHKVQFITNVAHLVMSVGQLHRPAWCTPDVCRCKSTSFLHPVMIIPNSSRTHWGVIYQIWKQCRYFFNFVTDKINWIFSSNLYPFVERFTSQGLCNPELVWRATLWQQYLLISSSSKCIFCRQKQNWCHCLGKKKLGWPKIQSNYQGRHFFVISSVLFFRLAALVNAQTLFFAF